MFRLSETERLSLKLTSVADLDSKPPREMSLIMDQVFNEKELLEELDGDLEFLAESVEILDEDSAKLMEQLKQAFAEQDADTVAKTAHTIKSMVGNFSADPAFNAALAVETMGRNADLSLGAAAIEELESTIGQLQQALHEFLRSAN